MNRFKLTGRISERFFIYLMLYFIFSIISLHAFQTGVLKGRVLDEDIKSPIEEVLVKIAGIDLELKTDTDGNFLFPEVPPGIYVLEFSHPFFVGKYVPDIVVKPGRIAFVDVEMRLNIEMEEEVKVTAGYFKESGLRAGGAVVFSNEEIRRAAGSAGDVSRIISGLPSIARVNDMQNNLVVRGGSPAENSFFIDNIEIPNINHYPSLGSSAGSIGLLNVDFIRDVRFFSGGFSPAYGNRLSSVMDVSFREGNHDETDFQLDLSLMGVGAVAEGPLNRGRGSWLFSARRSYIDLLIELMGSGVPVSWSDFQGKVNYQLDSGNKLSFLWVTGIDDSGTQKDDALADGESYYGGLDTKEYTVGLNWFSMWGRRGYSNTSISHYSTSFRNTAYHTVSEQLARKGMDLEQAFTLRNINVYRPGELHKISLGLELKHLVNQYDQYSAEYTDVMGNTILDNIRKRRISSQEYALFLDHSWDSLPLLTHSLGLRADYYSHTGNYHLSPRLAFSWRISSRSTLEGSLGIFFQSLPHVLVIQEDTHVDLKDPAALHFILGFRHLPTESTRLSIEIYEKEYSHLPLDPTQPGLFVFDEIFYGGFFSRHKNLTDSGKARSYGIELMLQKKLKDKLYGMISACYFRSLYRGLDGVWRNRVYDNRIIFAVEGGYKFSSSWEFGIKWNYAGGTPYTPYDLSKSQSRNSGIFNWSRINAERLPPYHSLNLRADKRFYFHSSSLIIYLSLWNVFNRKNPLSYYWNTIENKPDTSISWGLLPVLGIEFEF